MISDIGEPYENKAFPKAVQVFLQGVMHMIVTVRTHIGKVRPNNEDDFLLCEPNLFAVADGMGGYNAGEVASRTALEVLKKEISNMGAPPFSEVEACLHEIIAKVNESVHSLSCSSEDYSGMGTTLTGVFLEDAEFLNPMEPIRALFFNVGDSRGYIFRNASLKRITKDHSLIAEMLEQGKITGEEAFTHPKKNVITRSIGADAIVESDVFSALIYPGDVILLCSDGLTDMLTEEEVTAVLAEKGAKGADELLEMALEHGGRDNITFIIIDFAKDVADCSEEVQYNTAPQVEEAQYNTATQVEEVPREAKDAVNHTEVSPISRGKEEANDR